MPPSFLAWLRKDLSSADRKVWRAAYLMACKTCGIDLPPGWQAASSDRDKLQAEIEVEHLNILNNGL